MRRLLGNFLCRGVSCDTRLTTNCTDNFTLVKNSISGILLDFLDAGYSNINPVANQYPVSMFLCYHSLLSETTHHVSVIHAMAYFSNCILMMSHHCLPTTNKLVLAITKYAITDKYLESQVHIQ